LTSPEGDQKSRNAWIGAFAYHDYRMLWIGNLASTGTMTLRNLTALQWLYEETGSAALLGVLGLTQLVQMPLVIYGGALADNTDRKRLMSLTQLIPFVMLVGLTISAATDRLEPWHIFFVTMVSGMALTLGQPARTAMVSRVVPRRALPQAVAANSATMQIASVIVPLIFILLFKIWGPAGSFGTAAVLGGLTVFLPYLIRVSGAPAAGAKKVSIKSLVEGWKYVRSHRILPGLYLMDIGVTVMSFYRELFPIFADQLYGYGAGGVGLLRSSNSIGGIAGSMVVLKTNSWKRKGLLVLGATMVYAVLLIAFGFNTNFFIGLGIVALLGATDAIGMVMRQMIVQLTTPDAMLGRATSAHSFSAMGANHIGQAEVGAMSGAIGAGNTMVLGGVVSVAVVLLVWKYLPGVRKYEYTDQDPNAPPDTS
jgi:MFS family permease